MPPTCPRCHTSDCCASPWQSDQERLAHRRESAWRCKACLHRFFTPGGLQRIRENPIVATVFGSTFLMVAAVIVIMWFWKNG